MSHSPISRRAFLAATTAAGMGVAAGLSRRCAAGKKALIAITLDLEMSRHYPRRGLTEWDYRKGELDDATKGYSVKAARLVKERGGVIHFFALGRTLEQPDVGWLKQIAAAGHPVGNHTYDHVNVLARKREEIQYRFRRAPWLIRGKSVRTVIEENIRTTTLALKQRIGLSADGFRTPGGFRRGLADRPDLQHMLLGLGFRWISSLYPAHDAGKPKAEPTPEVYASIVKAQQQAQQFRYKTGLIEVPMSPISDVKAFRSRFWKLAWFKKAIRLAVERAIATGGTFDFLCHPSCLVVEDPRLETIAMICDQVNAAGNKAAIADLGTLAGRA